MLKERDELHALINQLPEKELFKIKQLIVQKIFDSQVEIIIPTEEEKKELDEAISDKEVYSFDEVFKDVD